MNWPWPAPADDGGARHLVPGRPIPDAALPATRRGIVQLASLTGRTILFFYPWTGSPGRPNPPGWDDIPGAHGSTPQAQGFAEAYQYYQAAGVEIIGISMQAPAEQSAFATRMSLPYDLASDKAGYLSAALELPTFMAGDVVYLKRLTLVVNDRLIERVLYPVHPPDTHAADLLALL